MNKVRLRHGLLALGTWSILAIGCEDHGARAPEPSSSDLASQVVGGDRFDNALAGQDRGEGRCFVVAPDGDDLNPGSVLEPWRTLEKAARTVLPGDVVLVRDGEYPAGTTIRVSGTARQPIIFRNFPGERPVIDGRGQIDYGLLLAEARFIHVRGFEVRNIIMQVASTRSPDPYGVPEDHPSPSGGITLKDASDNVIEGNVVHTGGYPDPGETRVGAIGVRLFSVTPHKGTRRNVVRGNECYHSHSGAHTFGPASDNVFEGNHFHDNFESRQHSDGAGQNAARYLRDLNPLNTPKADPRYTPHRSLYRYNVVERNADDGLDMWVSTGNRLEYNSVSGSGRGPKAGNGNGYKMGPGGGNIVRFNLAHRNLRKAFDDNEGTGNVWTENIGFDNGSFGDARSHNRYVVSPAWWARHELRRQIESSIRAFRDELTETVPPPPPRHVRREGDIVSWEAPGQAPDGDAAILYLVYAGRKIVGLTGGTRFQMPSGESEATTVRALDDSFADNLSAAGRVASR